MLPDVLSVLHIAQCDDADEDWVVEPASSAVTDTNPADVQISMLLELSERLMAAAVVIILNNITKAKQRAAKDLLARVNIIE